MWKWKRVRQSVASEKSGKASIGESFLNDVSTCFFLADLPGVIRIYKS